MTHSTNSHVVGKWINNKPTYEKSFELTTGRNNNWNTVLNDNIEDITDFYYQYARIQTTPVERYPLTPEFKFYVKNGALMENHSDDYYSGGILLVVVEYTKTTD